MRYWLLLLVVLCGCEGITIDLPSSQTPPVPVIVPRRNIDVDINIDRMRRDRDAREASWAGTSLEVAVNNYRESKGLRSLDVSVELDEVAKSWAAVMAKYGECEHSNWGLPENIAVGQDTAADVLDSWAHSPGHKETMLGRYEFSGAAMCVDKNGTKYWVMVFR